MCIKNINLSFFDKNSLYSKLSIKMKDTAPSPAELFITHMCIYKLHKKYKCWNLISEQLFILKQLQSNSILNDQITLNIF